MTGDSLRRSRINHPDMPDGAMLVCTMLVALVVANVFGLRDTPGSTAAADPVAWQQVYGGCANGRYCRWLYAENTLDFSELSLADIDADGDLDLFSRESAMHKNLGTAQSPRWMYPPESMPWGAPHRPIFADIDGDGDLDGFCGEEDGTITFYENIGTSHSPTWTTATTNYASIDVGDYAAPVFGDTDGDDDLDLLVGTGPGTITYFENIGTAQTAVWAAPIENYGAIDVGSHCKPLLADVDGDSDLDLLSGSSYPSSVMALFFENTGTLYSASWATPVILEGGADTLADMDGDGDIDRVVGSEYGRICLYENLLVQPTTIRYWAPPVTDYNSIDIGTNSTPTFADIDGDGDHDLFVGSQDGTITLYENIGDSNLPAWASAATNYGGIDVGNHSAPVFADTDADGDPDLFVGHDGGLDFFENTGTHELASWAAASSLSTDSSRPTLCDIDADGDFDLFVCRPYDTPYGTYGTLAFYRNVGTSFSAVWSVPSPTLTLDSSMMPEWGAALADTDSDGDFDLFFGRYIYENRGSLHTPLWDHPPVDGYDIGFDYYDAPTFADIDNDGDQDLFSGHYDGTITFHERCLAPHPVVWATRVVVQTCLIFFQEIQNAALLADLADLDGDDDLDAIICPEIDVDYPNLLFLYENNGAIQTADWLPSPQGLCHLRQGIDEPSYEFADIDTDGDFDMFIKCYDTVEEIEGIQFYENTGTGTFPSFTFRTNLYAGLDLESYSGVTTIELADLDGDGDLDLFFNDQMDDPRVLRLENMGTPFEAIWDWDPELTDLPAVSPSSYWKGFSFGDVDSDNDLDFLGFVYGSGELWFCENVGTRQEAVWSACVLALIDLPGDFNFELGDLDADGDLDIFAMNNDARVYFFQNTLFTLQISPPMATVGLNATQQFEVVGATEAVTWSIVENNSGGAIDPVTGLYTAGPTCNKVDAIEAMTTPSGLRGRATVHVIPPPFVPGEKIIICAGGGNYPGNSILTQTNYLADYAFRMSLERGYTAESIYYLNADTSQIHDGDGDGFDDTDAMANLANLEWAITTWGSDVGRLFIHLVDHGTQTQFRVNATQFLSGSTFDSWLDALQTAHGTTVIVIADYCYSGSFLAASTAPSGRNRAVFASAGPTQMAVFLAPYGYISFSNFFLGYAHSGANLFNCFAWTRDAIAFTYSGQVPRLDDTGDGAMTKDDGYYALTQYWGYDYGYGATAPEIIDFATDQTLTGDTTATLWCEVVPTLPIDSVWVTVVPPGGMEYVEGEPITDIPRVELQSSGPNVYSGTWDGFDEDDEYKVVYFAVDTEGRLSWPVQGRVYQSCGPDAYEEDDTALEARPVVVDWTESQQHNFHDAGDHDWTYAFLLGGGTYHVISEDLGTACDLMIEIFDSPSATTPIRIEDAYGPGLPESFVWPCPATGIYYFRLRDYNPATYCENTDYRFKVNGDSGANNGLALALGSNAMHCEWTGTLEPGDVGFNLYRTDSPISEAWTKVNGSLLSGNSCDDNGLLPETAYFYVVKAEQSGGAERQWTPIFFGFTESDTTPPVVTSITRLDPSPTDASQVRFAVAFDEAVTGVDLPDFSLTVSGLSGASVADVAGSGMTRTVSVSTGTGSGSLRLDLVDDDTILNLSGIPLGGLGVGNGTYTSGQVYQVEPSQSTGVQLENWTAYE